MDESRGSNDYPATPGQGRSPSSPRTALDQDEMAGPRASWKGDATRWEPWQRGGGNKKVHGLATNLAELVRVAPEELGSTLAGLVKGTSEKQPQCSWHGQCLSYSHMFALLGASWVSCCWFGPGFRNKQYF